MKTIMEEAAKEAAQAVRDGVFHHIDTMYPEVGKSMSKSARVSIGNTIKNMVAAHVMRVLPDHDAVRRCVDLADTLRHLMNAQQLATLTELRATANQLSTDLKEPTP